MSKSDQSNQPNRVEKRANHAVLKQAKNSATELPNEPQLHDLKFSGLLCPPMADFEQKS